MQQLCVGQWCHHSPFRAPLKHRNIVIFNLITLVLIITSVAMIRIIVTRRHDQNHRDCSHFGSSCDFSHFGSRPSS